MRCAIHSASSGSVMVIPRENKLVRLYIQLTEVEPDATGRADRSKITPDTILKAAQKTLSPYRLTYDYCDWWTAYQVIHYLHSHFPQSSRSNKYRLCGLLTISRHHTYKFGRGGLYHSLRLTCDRLAREWANNSPLTSESSSLGTQFTPILPRPGKA